MFKLMIDRITNEQPIDPQASIQKKIKEPVANQNEMKTEGLKLTFAGKCIITLNSKESKEALTEQTRNLYFLQRLGYLVG